MRTAWWLGGLYELLTRLHRPLGWRAYQRLRTWALHARDLAVCLVAMATWAAALWMAL